MEIGAGEFNRRITINRVETSNQGGIAKRSQVVVATVWAKMQPLNRDEKYSQEQTTAQADYEFLIRYSTDVADIRPKDTITFAKNGAASSQIFEVIAAPKEIGLRKYLILKVRLLDGNS